MPATPFLRRSIAVPRPTILFCLLLVLVLGAQTTTSYAAAPGATLLPATTKGYVSVPDVDALREKWNETQLGQLVQDPVMKPFVEDLKKQIQAKVGKTEIRLSIRLEDLEEVYGGEVCLATIQPGGDEQQHAMALVVDITDHRQQADILLAQVARDLTSQGAKRSVETVRGVAVNGYVLPRQGSETVGREAYYFIHDDVLVATDHRATAVEILGRFFGEGQSLQDVVAYQMAMQRCQQASGDTQPHVRWFVEPFGYIQAVRAASGGRKKRGTDLLKVLANQGFTAVQGLGGHVLFATEGHEIIHKTLIYAPQVKPGAEKYELAMRMLDFPNAPLPAPQSWVPHDVTNYLTLNWKMKEAFEYSKTLVDEIAGAPVFDDIMDSLKRDPNGPRVDLRAGLVWHLGERATFLTDYRLPIDPTCERWLAALEVTDPAVVAATLDKAMQPDPDARKRTVAGRTVWEIVQDAEPAEVEELEIDGPGFGDFGDVEEAEDEDQEERGPLLSHAAFTVAHGHLMVASHLDFLEDILLQESDTQPLDETKDYVMVENALQQLGAGTGSVRYFSRTDKAYHPTYELIRQGKMPESETLFANLLNRIFGPEEEGVLREQQLQGDKLPDYEQIRGYLGPSGAYVNSEPNGWYVAGTLLTKPTDGMEAAGPIVSRRANQRR
jgi:hypothetical protein